MDKVRWGVLSTAKIGVEKVIPGMQKTKSCDIVAIASRDLVKAQQAASELGIERAFGSYDELLADKSVQAIYNPLPNHLHVPWSVKVLDAGKHLLCEKPIGMSAAEGEQLVKASRRSPSLKVMEAFMYRHHPQWKKAKSLVDEGAIGDLRTVNTLFSYFNDDPGNIRNQAESGGGALMDIGCYPISFGRLLFNSEPDRVLGILDLDPRFQTDRVTSGILDFGHGTLTFTCSTQMANYQRTNICGSHGRIEIEIPVNAPPDRPCRLWLQHESGISEMEFEICDQYGIQGDLFSQAVMNDTPVPTPIEDAVANMRVIERLVLSSKTSLWT